MRFPSILAGFIAMVALAAANSTTRVTSTLSVLPTANGTFFSNSSQPTEIGVGLQPDGKAEFNCAVDNYWLAYRYHVKTNIPVDNGNIGSLCGRLWAILHTALGCDTPSNTWCGDAGERILSWDFTVFPACTGSRVESVWDQATGNAYGEIVCPGWTG